ncbi:MAG: hypothetical protein ACRC80_08645 [Waterburya sp.]
MPRALGNRSLVHCTVDAIIADVRYGFQSAADAADMAILGQNSIASVFAVPGLVVAANNLKPGKAKKILASGSSESSFYSYGQRVALEAANWRTSNPVIERRSNGRLSTAFYVTLNGLRLGWVNTPPPAAAMAEFASLGITAVPAAGLNDIFFGASFPRLPRVAKIFGTSRISTPFDPSRISDATQLDWTIIDRGKYA